MRFLPALMMAAALAATGASAAAADSVKAPHPAGAVAQAMSVPALLSGRFVQEKSMAGFKKPLVSRGDFLVAKDKGVIWRTQKPFRSAFALTPKGIFNLRANDTAVKREAVHKGKVDAALDLVQKVLSGDRAALAKSFTLAEGGTPGAWTLELKPKDRMVAKFMQGIRMEGGLRVDRIEFREANGDWTRIAFSDVTDSAGDLGLWQAEAFRD